MSGKELFVVFDELYSNLEALEEKLKAEPRDERMKTNLERINEMKFLVSDCRWEYWYD